MNSDDTPSLREGSTSGGAAPRREMTARDASPRETALREVPHRPRGEFERLADRTRPFLDQYGVMLLWIVAGVIVLGVIAFVATRMMRPTAGAGWDDLLVASVDRERAAERYAALAEDHPGTAAAGWAKLMEAEERFRAGERGVFVNPATARKSFADAAAAYDEVLARSDLSPELRVRALFGSAQALEVTGEGKLAPAIERYRQVVEEFGETPYAPLANERLTALAAPDVAQFYAWFARQQSSGSDLTRPADPTPFTPPSLESLLADPPRSGSPSAESLPSEPIEAPRPVVPATP